MNASRDPWTDDEITVALNRADATDAPPVELLTHLISLFQRTTIALERIAKSCEPEVLFEESPHRSREDVDDETENDDLQDESEDRQKH